MDYTNGSRIIRALKRYKCELCGEIMPYGGKYFTRIIEYGKKLQNKNGKIYRNKIYKRYHSDCALQLKDLNDIEKGLLTPFIMAKFSTQLPLGGTNVDKKASVGVSMGDR